MKNSKKLYLIYSVNLFLHLAHVFLGCAGESNGFIYDYERGAITVNGFRNINQVDVIVPSEIEGMTVTKLEGGAFSGLRSARRIVIPETIAEIGSGCFAGCESLLDFEIHNGIVEIPLRCFAGCKSLKKINIASTVKTISQSAFSDCISLSEIGWHDQTLGRNVQIIESYAFQGCQSLVEITFGAGLTKLGTGAFANCDSLSVIRWGDRGLGGIGFDPYPFLDCDRVKKIFIPELYHNDWWAEKLWLDYIYPDGFYTPEGLPASKASELKLRMVPSINVTGTIGSIITLERATSSPDGPWHLWKTVVLGKAGSTVIDLEEGDDFRFYRVKP